MQSLPTFIAHALVSVGIGILTIALMSIRKLARGLAPQNALHKWHLLTAIVVFLIFEYIIYLAVQLNAGEADIFLSTIFFFTACFVYIVGRLSFETTFDLQRLEVLEHESITDALTKLYNRRYLDSSLADAVSFAQRYNLPLSVLLIDADHFKQINDTHGHHTGDLALIALAETITETVRENDIVARYGGEEITVMTPNTAIDHAVELAERLRRKIEASTAVPSSVKGDTEPVPLRVSIGVACLGKTVTDAKTLLNSADEALYHAKLSGRNRVSVAVPLKTGTDA
ncbi:MAG: GGDEF domain-containing protein [Pseudomonadales bacterium]